MENEIKVKDFVRYKDGDIIQIINKVEKEYVIKDNKDGIYALPESAVYKDIVKHSPNLIDLIQKDDFVNGHKVIKPKQSITYASVEVENSIAKIEIIPEKDIKEVVTKEMMESISYKVETH